MRYFLIALLLSVTSAEAEECFHWKDARKIIVVENLVRGYEALRVAKSKSTVKIAGVVSFKLCNDNGRYVYRAQMVDADNHVETIVMDARKKLPPLHLKINPFPFRAGVVPR